MKRKKITYEVSITLENRTTKHLRFNSARRLRAVLCHFKIDSLGVWKLTPVGNFRKYPNCFIEKRMKNSAIINSR